MSMEKVSSQRNLGQPLNQVVTVHIPTMSHVVSYPKSDTSPSVVSDKRGLSAEHLTAPLKGHENQGKPKPVTCEGKYRVIVANAIWHPGIEKDISGVTGEIWIKS